VPLRIRVQGLEGLTLISPNEPTFDELVRPILGRVADIGLQLKPLLVVLANESPKTVVAFSITWRVIYRSGQTSTFRNLASFPDVVCGDLLVSRHPPGVPPGTLRVEANGLVIHTWSQTDEYSDQFLPQFVDEKDRTLANAVDLSIELGAAIFDDGTLIGPDEGSWVRDNFSQYVTAKKDWYRGIIAALDEGRTVAEAYEPLDEFTAARIDLVRSGRLRLLEDRDAWKQQAAADVHSWRTKYSEAEIPRLLKENIRLEPFVIHRRDTERG
jgi:hypothetical protein